MTRPSVPMGAFRLSAVGNASCANTCCAQAASHLDPRGEVTLRAEAGPPGMQEPRGQSMNLVVHCDLKPASHYHSPTCSLAEGALLSRQEARSGIPFSCLEPELADGFYSQQDPGSPGGHYCSKHPL